MHTGPSDYLNAEQLDQLKSETRHAEKQLQERAEAPKPVKTLEQLTRECNDALLASLDLEATMQGKAQTLRESNKKLNAILQGGPGSIEDFRKLMLECSNLKADYEDLNHKQYLARDAALEAHTEALACLAKQAGLPESRKPFNPEVTG